MDPRVPLRPLSLPLPTIRAQGPSSVQTLPAVLRAASKFGRVSAFPLDEALVRQIPSTLRPCMDHSLLGFRLTQPELVFNPAAKMLRLTPLLSSCIEKRKKKKTEKAKTKSPPPSGKPQKPSWWHASCLFLLRLFAQWGPRGSMVSSLQPRSPCLQPRACGQGRPLVLAEFIARKPDSSELWCQGLVWRD